MVSVVAVAEGLGFVPWKHGLTPTTLRCTFTCTTQMKFTEYDTSGVVSLSMYNAPRLMHDERKQHNDTHMYIYIYILNYIYIYIYDQLGYKKSP